MLTPQYLSCWLFVPGNDQRKIERAAASPAQALILDWEDAVLPEHKELARQCSRRMDDLLRIDKFILVRINSSRSQWHADDLKQIAAIRPHGVILPKCESAHEIQKVTGVLQSETPNWEFSLCPIIESPVGLLRAEAIATASDRVRALLFGCYDFCTQAGIHPSAGEAELLMARSQIVAVAKAFGLAAVDSPMLVLDDIELIREAALRSYRLGFTGKLAIHPAHIRPITESFAPTSDEVREADEILRQAEILKVGAFAWNGQVIDEAILENARTTLRRFQASSKT
jgi:citrate lyase subunit beta/citryl-CoA lyase